MIFLEKFNLKRVRKTWANSCSQKNQNDYNELSPSKKAGHFRGGWQVGMRAQLEGGGQAWGRAGELAQTLHRLYSMSVLIAKWAWGPVLGFRLWAPSSLLFKLGPLEPQVYGIFFKLSPKTPMPREKFLQEQAGTSAGAASHLLAKITPSAYIKGKWRTPMETSSNVAM